jgi:ParB-like nuclease domain
MSSQDSPHFNALKNDAWLYLCTLADHRTWRVDQAGWYEEFITAPLAMFEPSEPDDEKSHCLIEKYATQFLNGSQFPPVSARGLETGYTTYQIVDGHHRRLAAIKADAKTLDAWINFYVDYHGKMIPSGEPYTASHCAHMADTQEGRRLARILDRHHCPCCGHYLNFDGKECHSCFYPNIKTETWEYYTNYPHRLLDMESHACC